MRDTPRRAPQRQPCADAPLKLPPPLRHAVTHADACRRLSYDAEFTRRASMLTPPRRSPMPSAAALTRWPPFDARRQPLPSPPPLPPRRRRRRASLTMPERAPPAALPHEKPCRAMRQFPAAHDATPRRADVY